MSNPRQRVPRQALTIFLAAVSGFVFVLALGVTQVVTSPGVQAASEVTDNTAVKAPSLISPTPGQCGVGQPQAWRTAAAGPGTRYMAGGASDGQYVYVFGGSSDAYLEDVILNDLWRWNPATETWTRLADMPTAKMDIQGTYWNGKIYVPGGYDASDQHISELSIYDITSNTWSVGMPMPTGRSGVATAAYGGKVYAMGGYNEASRFTTTVMAYDIASDTWSQVAPLPRPMSYGRAITVGSDIYHVAGADGGIGGYLPASRFLFRYDPNSNVWDQMAPLHTERAAHEVMTDGTRIYAVNGAIGLNLWNGIPQNQTVEIYDVANNAWSYGNPTTRTAVGSAGGYAGGKLMVMGGNDAHLTFNLVQVSEVPLGPCPTAGTPVTRTPTPTPSNTATRTNTRTPTASRTPFPTPLPCGDWQFVEAPDGSPVINTMMGVDAVSSADVWAVGYSTQGGYPRPMTQHWDGSSWQIVGTTFMTATLRGVVAISSHDVWAVGYASPPQNGPDSTLTMHWDGTIWSVVPSPNIPGEQSNYLYAVDAGGPNDVWAVGYGNFGALTMHWDGAQWTLVPVLDPISVELDGVAVAGPNDVWAVGTLNYDSYIAHWDGNAWTRVSSPNPGLYENDLNAVTAIAPDDVWAVGEQADHDAGYVGLAVHWDGTSWELSPLSGSAESEMSFGSHLHAVAGVASDEVWAVGREEANSVSASVLMRWDGSAWTRVTTPDPQSNYTLLYGVASVAPGEAWAVGEYWAGDQRAYRALTFRYGPPCGTPTSTSTPGGPTNTPTATRTPTGTPVSPATSVPTSTPNSTSTPEATFEPTSIPTSEPTSEPTLPPTATPSAPTVTPEGTVQPCSIEYSDVTPDSPFYQQIMCLSCMSLVGGYADGTFRPNNEVTRGQLSKIVANTAGFDDIVPVNLQTFEDVPPGTTFHMYIERMAARNIIGGYACGGEGEPCGPGNRPYFRPEANATRGQISKIMSSAMFLNDEPTGQTFEDVPAGHSFYVWIERLAEHDMMSGYACGSEGEPCGVGNRPYFRPYNNATRGQTAKINGNGFYPDCQSQRGPLDR
jgi:N-acetylneuraminic acid mutarotase